MIIPGVYGVSILAGDQFDLWLNWKDDNGILFNLTGWHARLSFFLSKSDRTLILQVIDTNGGILLGNGTVEPNITCTVLQNLTTFGAPPGYYTLELQNPSGVWQRILEGIVGYSK